MAALMDSIAFCHISNENDILSISESMTDDCIQISCKRKTFDILKLSDQRPVKSWSLHHGVTVTSPVVWEAHHLRFITVTNNEDVRVWDKDTADFDKAKRKHSATKMHQLLPVPGHDMVVMYTDGCVGFLADLKTHKGQGPLTDTDTILWCQAGQLQSMVYVMAVVKSQTGLLLYTNWYMPDTRSWTQSNTTLPHTSSELSSCDSYTHTDSVSLYLLGCSGDLSCMRVTVDSVTESGSIQTLAGVSANSSLICLDDTHVAIANIRKDTEAGICIYDTKFGVEHAWKLLPEKPKSKLKVFSVHGRLFVPCGRNIYMYKYECAPSSVVSLLGHNISSQLSDTNTVPGHYKWTAGYTVQKDCAQPTDLADIFNRLCSTKLTLEGFRGAFRQLRKELLKSENHHWLMSNYMCSLIKRIVEEDTFWPSAEVRRLIELQCIPQGLLGSWVETLIQHQEVELVQMVMETLPNIPEICLCKAISFYLQCEEGVLQKVTGSHTTPSVGSLNSCRAHLINQVLVLPYSDVFLLECLRNVSFKHAIKLLDYLAYVLEHGSSVNDGDKSSSDECSVPSIEHVVDWLSLVLDAHMTHFVLSPDCHVSLVKLQTIVASQVEQYETLCSLEALLEQLNARSSVSRDKAVGQYCIEMLHIL